MKKHTKIYLEGMKIPICERFEDMYIKCEMPTCYRPSVDINHIYARGLGGSKTKDYLENLVAMCREHHLDFEAKKISKEELKEIHLNNLPS
jgi:hypothetical protein